MATIKPSYGGLTTITMTLASLASDTNLVAGRESNTVDNSSDLADDSLVMVQVKLGTTPTANRVVEIWAIGQDGTDIAGGATGLDANLTPQSKGCFNMLGAIPTNSTTGQVYLAGPFSIAQAFGGTMPKKWSLYIVQNTGAAFDATGGNFLVKYTPIQYSVV